MFTQIRKAHNIMTFPNNYFNDEIREGFFVTSMMKRNWAAQLQVLEDIDRLCQKYNIKYYGDCGTLIGAVRHGGFIPWDDDLDICLLREDYELLLAHADELPDNYALLSWRTRNDWSEAYARIVNDTWFNLNKDFLEKYHGFPYPSGIDIFVLDYMYEDNNQEEDRRLRAKLLIDTANTLLNESSITDDYLQCLHDIEDALDIKIDFNKSIPQQLFLYAEKAMTEVKRKDASKVCFMSSWILFHSCFWEKKYCNQIMRVPFECTTMPIPVAYDEILKAHYGDYMKVNRTGSMHDYPCYAKLENFLKEKIGRKLWECQWNRQELNLRDKLKAEEESNVKQLEENIKKIEALIESNPDLYGSFRAQLDTLKQGLNNSPAKKPSKEEVVFLPISPENWTNFSHFWHKEISNPNTNVYVIPISYFDTSIDGTTLRTHYITNGYEVPIVSLNEYDILRRHPSRIYIQCPYDDINPAMTIHKEFYSNKLLKYTDELIYVPMFKIKDYDSNDTKSAYTLNFIVKTPVMLHADKVFLPSQKLKDEYIKILVDFSMGETDVNYWDRKIFVEDYMAEESEESSSTKQKKTLMFYSDVAPIALYGDKALKKIRTSLELMRNASNKLNIIWLTSENMKSVLNSPSCKDGKKLYGKFINIVQEYKKEAWGTFMEHESDVNLQEIDAYAGNPSPYAHYLSYNKKPVMILKDYDD